MRSYIPSINISPLLNHNFDSISSKNTIEKFKDSYPDLSVGVRKEMKTIYGLSKAKKSMRNHI